MINGPFKSEVRLRILRGENKTFLRNFQRLISLESSPGRKSLLSGSGYEYPKQWKLFKFYRVTHKE